MTNAQTLSRGAAISTVPSKCIDASVTSGIGGQSCIDEYSVASRNVAGSLMNRVRQPIEQNA